MAKKRGVFHLVTCMGGWCLHIGAGLHVALPDGPKKVAIAAAVSMVKKHEPSQLVIHNLDGTVSEERTYGADPRRSKG